MSFKKVWNAVTTALTALIVLAAVGLVVLRILGFGAYTVLSGSMEPTYHVGSVIFVRSTGYGEIKTGDVITYTASGGAVVTHRVIEVEKNGYRTKGDANDAADGSLVPRTAVIGKPIFSVPLLGYVANYFTNPPGMYLGVMIIAALVFSVFLPEKPKEQQDRV